MLTRQQLTNFMMETALPRLDAIAYKTLNDEIPAQYPHFFQVKTMTGAISQSAQLSGLGLPRETPELEGTPYDKPIEGFTKTFKARTFRLGSAISYEMAQDGKWLDFGGRMAQALARSFKFAKEYDAAAVVNLGFTQNGLDGVPLFSVAHPKVKGGVLQSNRSSSASVAAVWDLDIPNLRLALTACRRMVDINGHPVHFRPNCLAIPPELDWTATEIFKSDRRADSANFTINAFKEADSGTVRDVKVWDYLTSPANWFLFANPKRTGLKFFQREAFNIRKHHDDQNDAFMQRALERWDCGYDSDEGVFGALGA
jgi:hypothetical protein